MVTKISKTSLKRKDRQMIKHYIQEMKAMWEDSTLYEKSIIILLVWWVFILLALIQCLLGEE